MDSPLKHHFDPAERPDCLDVSPERLNPMTAAQLERELEAALEAMTEAEYDPAVIDAYLDALDRKAPMPDHPDAGTAYAGFQARVQRAAGQVSGRRASRRSRVRLRTLLRVAAAAALLTTFLFSSMVVAPGVRRGCVRRHRPLDGQRVQLRRAARGGCVRLCPGRRPGGAGQSNRQEGCPGRISRNI